MEQVVIRNSRSWPLAVVSAGAVALTASALFGGTDSPLFALELVGAVLCGVLATWLLLDRRPQVILDDRGILDRRLRVGLIPWSRIQRAYAQPLGGIQMVWVEMSRDPSGTPPSERVPLRVTDLSITTEQLLALIAKGRVGAK